MVTPIILNILCVDCVPVAGPGYVAGLLAGPEADPAPQLTLPRALNYALK